MILSWQDTGASCDKASVCSGRSTSNSERLFVGDHPHLHSHHLFHHRVPKLGARAQSIESSSSLTNQIPENSVVNVATTAPSTSSAASFYHSDTNMPSTSSATISEHDDVVFATAAGHASSSANKTELNASPSTSTKANANNSMSKAAILRSLFFSQSQNGANNNSSSKS